MDTNVRPGLIVLLGSGETQPSSSKTHEYVAQRLGPDPHIAILETPAGFELNSDMVAGRIKAFLERKLQNYAPEIEVIAARRRGMRFSPDNMEIVSPLFKANEILLGPGSPTYCTRQLKGSLAYEILRSRHRTGTVIFLSSAATISFGEFALPVYEIYKVGEEPFWSRGLNFFGDYGMRLAVVPHWNNNDGGVELDTSHCYIGESRFEALRRALPAEVTILGIDDHTSVVLDLESQSGSVFGSDSITILQGEAMHRFESGEHFPLTLLGTVRFPGSEGISPWVWEAAQKAQVEQARRPANPPPAHVLALVDARETARQANDWVTADALRESIAAEGWQVMDTSEGPKLSPGRRLDRK